MMTENLKKEKNIYKNLYIKRGLAHELGIDSGLPGQVTVESSPLKNILAL